MRNYHLLRDQRDWLWKRWFNLLALLHQVKHTYKVYTVFSRRDTRMHLDKMDRQLGWRISYKKRVRPIAYTTRHFELHAATEAVKVHWSGRTDQNKKSGKSDERIADATPGTSRQKESNPVLSITAPQNWAKNNSDLDMRCITERRYWSWILIESTKNWTTNLKNQTKNQSCSNFPKS